MSRTVSSQDAVTASSMHQKAMSRRLFAWRRRATDATELFDDDEHFDYLNDIQGEGGGVDNSNGSRASTKSRFRRWGRAHSTGKVMQRSGSAERPARTQSAERGGGRQTPATPSVLATPAAAVATPAVLMASYDSAKGRLPPSGRHYKTPYQERQLLYSAQQQQHSRSFAARQTPVNLAALKRDMQQQRPPVAAAGGRRPPLRQQEHAPTAAGQNKQQQQKQQKQQQKQLTRTNSSSRRAAAPAQSVATSNTQERQASQKGMLRRIRGQDPPQQKQQQQQQSSSSTQGGLADPPAAQQQHSSVRRLTSYLAPQQQANMQAQHAADQKLVKKNGDTAVYQQPHAPVPAAAATAVVVNNRNSVATAVAPATAGAPPRPPQQQQRSTMVQARLDRRMQTAHRMTSSNSAGVGFEMPTRVGAFSSSVVPPIAEHPTPNSHFDDSTMSWEEGSVMSAGRILVNPSISRPRSRTSRSRSNSPLERRYLGDEKSPLHDSWSNDGGKEDEQDPSPSLSNDDSMESPDSDHDLDNSNTSGSADQYLMMDMDVVGNNTEARSKQKPPRSFPRAQKMSRHSAYHHAHNPRRVQLPEYYRSYNFGDDPTAIQPKIRKREDRDAASLAGTAFSSTSRTSLCSVSTRSFGAFSVQSAGAAGAASVMTSSTQGSTQSAATAPPNLWEVDRQMHKKKRNVETHTDFMKLVQSPTQNNDENLVKETILLSTANGGRGNHHHGGDLGTPSTWKGEAKGVPHKVSISFRRLTLRTQVRELKELLEDDQPSRMTASSTVPPTPPFHGRTTSAVQDLHLERKASSKKRKKKKGHHIRASI